MEKDSIRADKKLRRTIILLMIIGACAGFLLIQYTSDYFEEIRQISHEDPNEGLKRTVDFLRIILGLNALIFSLACLYFLGIAAKILKSGQYPPPGMKVIRDTKIRRGMKARMTAVMLIIFPLTVMIISILAYSYLPGVFERSLTESVEISNE